MGDKKLDDGEPKVVSLGQKGSPLSLLFQARVDDRWW